MHMSFPPEMERAERVWCAPQGEGSCWLGPSALGPFYLPFVCFWFFPIYPTAWLL